MKRLTTILASLFLVAACSGQAGSSATPGAATASPVASATAVQALEAVERGNQLAPGPYVLHYSSIGGVEAYPTLAITFSVPVGWQTVMLDGVLWHDGGTRLGFVVADNLFVDPCDGDKGLRSPAIGPSVDDLARELETVPGWQVIEKSEDTYFGYQGVRLVLAGPADLSACGEAGDRVSLLMHILGNPGVVVAISEDERHDLRILDVAGTRLIVDAITVDGATAGARAGLTEILDSISIQP